jgi:hypothetical protein
VQLQPRCNSSSSTHPFWWLQHHRASHTSTSRAETTISQPPPNPLLLRKAPASTPPTCQHQPQLPVGVSTIEHVPGAAPGPAPRVEVQQLTAGACRVERAAGRQRQTVVASIRPSRDLAGHAIRMHLAHPAAMEQGHHRHLEGYSPASCKRNSSRSRSKPTLPLVSTSDRQGHKQQVPQEPTCSTACSITTRLSQCRRA